MDLSAIPVIIISFLGISAGVLAVTYAKTLISTTTINCPSEYNYCYLEVWKGSTRVVNYKFYPSQDLTQRIWGYKVVTTTTTTVPSTTPTTTTTILGLLNPPVNQNGISIVMNDGSPNLRYDTNKYSPSVLNFAKIQSSSVPFNKVYVCVNNPSGELRFRIWGSNIQDMQGSQSYMSGSDVFTMPTCPTLFYIGKFTYAENVQLPMSGYIRNNVGTPSGSLSFQVVPV